MAMYKVYIGESLEYIVQAKSAMRAEEMVSDETGECWDEIHAEPVKLPKDVTTEQMYSPHQYTYLYEQ